MVCAFAVMMEERKFSVLDFIPYLADPFCVYVYETVIGTSL